MVQRQYLLLRGVGLATDELTEEYNNVIETVENGREVMWADQSLKDSDDGDKQSFIINCQSTTFGKLWHVCNHLLWFKVDWAPIQSH